MRSVPNGHDRDTDDTWAEDDVALQQQIDDLDAKTDDLRASITGVVTMQLQLVGKLDVLSTKLEAADKVTDLRLRNLEVARGTADLRAWVEKLAYALVGGGAYAAMVRLFQHTP